MAIWQSNRQQLALVHDTAGNKVGSYQLNILELVRTQSENMLPPIVQIETVRGFICQLKKEAFLAGFDPLPRGDASEDKFIQDSDRVRQSDSTGTL